MVDFKRMLEQDRQSRKWAKSLLSDLVEGSPFTTNNLITKIARALRDAYWQGRLGKELEEEE